MLLKHGARIDVEARMCWPGPHNQNCEQRGKYSSPFEPGGADQRSSDRLQSAVYYAIDGDQVRLRPWPRCRHQGDGTHVLGLIEMCGCAQSRGNPVEVMVVVA